MAVESNYAVGIATLKNLEPVYQPMKRKPKTTSKKVTWNRYEFGLVRCAVFTCCDWSKQLL